ncbi:hypothetical protein [Halovenus salina]|uniref:hypothetical protein n=1 Tax=Halovenus salina TaxID=1510225 RepID=UPI002260BD03|nr:hypothetical protein [Halovenus salina]
MSADTLATRVSRSRADYILFSLPVLFVGTYGMTRWAVSAGAHALAAAGLVCCLIVVDGLFIHPPVEYDEN